MPKDMETNQKLMTLLRLMDEPEAMTEAQLQELLADEEVREAYELMVDCKKVYRRMKNERMENEKFKLPLEDEGNDVASRLKNVQFSIHRIAAIFLAAAFLGGLAWASLRILAPLSSPEGDTLPDKQGIEAPSGAVGGAAIRFSNARLDSILTVVSAHYGKAVCFCDSAARELRLSTMWDCEDSLSVFIATLNEFDGLSLKEERDTVFVETHPSPSLVGRE